ncbi:MAG: hypothetical protein ACQEQF_00535 [Bacillota bacterium]
MKDILYLGIILVLITMLIISSTQNERLENVQELISFNKTALENLNLKYKNITKKQQKILEEQDVLIKKQQKIIDDKTKELKELKSQYLKLVNELE